MSQDSEESPSRKTTSPERRETGHVTEPSGTPSPRRPSRSTSLEEKTARLEQQIQRLERKTANGKFLLSFIGTILFLTATSVYIPGYAFAAIFLLAVVLLIALAYHWDFPEIVKPLNDLLAHLMRRRTGRRAPPSQDEEE